MNICPSLFYIVPDTPASPGTEDDIFMPDRFRILQEDLTQVKEIIANTSTKQSIGVRLLCCYRVKNLSRNYCEHRRIASPRKQICSEKSGIKTNYIHFYLKQKKVRSYEHFLAFIEGADLRVCSGALINEMLCLLAWLEVSAPHVFLNVFTIGKPIFSTGNKRHLHEQIDSATKKIKSNFKGTIACDVTHIKKSDNNLIVSNSDVLFFQSSQTP